MIFLTDNNYKGTVKSIKNFQEAIIELINIYEIKKFFLKENLV